MPSPDLLDAVERIAEAVRRLRAERERPVLIALDGPSGAGKSVLAALLAERLGATTVPGDDFFAADLTDAGWARRTPAERARDAIDWRRLRAEALEPLLAGKPARWHPFDFAAGTLPDGRYPMSAKAETREAAPVIVLDGAYSARPELADLIDLSVLVAAPSEVRRRRLAQREEPAFLAAWHIRWDAAEAYYFSEVRPPSSFDLVVTSAAG